MQKGATNTTPQLSIMSSGTYNLMGGTLNATNLYLDPAGVFTQSGGTAFTNNLAANGKFNLSGGTLYTYNLNLNPGSVFTLSSSGTLNASSNPATINLSGGVFNQTGGTLNIGPPGNININSNSTYSLVNGILNLGQVTLNLGGVFNQTGGTLSVLNFYQGGTVNGTLTTLNGNTAYTYNGGAFNGRLILNGPGTFNANFTATDGMENRYGNSLSDNKTFTFNGQGLTNNSTLSLNNNTILGSGPIINNAEMNGAAAYFDGTGAFTNNGSCMFQFLRINNNTENNNYGNLMIPSNGQNNLGYNNGRMAIRPGSTLNNYGHINMDSEMSVIQGGGTLVNKPGGLLSANGIINITNFQNNGILDIHDGNCSIINSFTNNGTIVLNSAMTGGTITNEIHGSILSAQEGAGVGNNIVNKGRIEAKNSLLYLEGVVTNTTSGRIMVTQPNAQLQISQGLANNLGKIILSGGDFDNNSYALQNNGQIVGYGSLRTGALTNIGTMTLSGGNTMVVGAVTNNGLMTLYNTTMFTDSVTNNGTIKTYGGVEKTNQLVFAGGYYGNGVYNSDPAIQTFSDVGIGSKGSWTGGVGDTFIIQHDFLNQSKNNLEWNTLKAELDFVVGDSNQHQMALPGSDKGAVRTGFKNNFAWGILDINGQILNLVDGNTDTRGGAFYVSEILGADVTGDTVSNIFGHGLNIYYDPLRPENAYLQGRRYFLQDGGLLAPVTASATPIPGSLTLVLSGLIGLVVIGRRGLTSKN